MKKKKIIRLINNERKNSAIRSGKAAGCTPEDFCLILDAATCMVQSVDVCYGKDLAACYYHAEDYCGGYSDDTVACVNYHSDYN